MPPRPDSTSDNLRGIGLMTLAMFGFALADMSIKLLGALIVVASGSCMLWRKRRLVGPVPA